MSKLSTSQAAWVRRLAARMPFYKYMGIRLTGLAWGRSKIKLRAGKGLTQNAGFAHGGVSASLIDSAVGLALCTMIDKSDLITTINLEVNFLAPAKPGIMIARGKIVHRGRRIAFGDANVTDQNGKLVSKGTATYMILEGRNTEHESKTA